MQALINDMEGWGGGGSSRCMLPQEILIVELLTLHLVHSEGL